MTELTQAQVDYVKKEVSKHGGSRYSFIAAHVAGNEDKLGVVTMFPNGDYHTASVSAGNEHLWLTHEDQFANVVAKAIDALGRP